MSSKNLMSYAYLLQSQREVAATTDRELNGIAKRFPIAIDTLLKLPYWIGNDPTAKGVFRGWAQSSYIAAGHSFAAMYQLYRSGFYLEATTIQRHLVEVLVQIGYFARRRTEADSHFMPPTLRLGVQVDPALMPPGMPKRKDAVKFRTMFEDVAPGYYDRWYRLVSELAHGGLGASLFRVDHRAGTVALGCQYSEPHAGFVIVQSVALMHGFLRRFPEAFPKWNDSEGGEVLASAVSSMDEILTSEWQASPGLRKRIEVVGKVGLWEAPKPSAQ